MLLVLPMLLVLAALLALPATAQPTAPFETFTLRLGGTVEAPNDRYGAVWQPSPGVDVAATVPFYLGLTFDAGLAFSNHRAQTETLLDFLAIHGYVGLGAGLQLPVGARLHLGAHAGVLSMDFYADEAAGAFARRESELATGLVAGGTAPLTDRLGVYVGARWTHVYTSTPIDLVRVHAGLTWTFVTPGWLRELLQ